MSAADDSATSPVVSRPRWPQLILWDLIVLACLIAIPFALLTRPFWEYPKKELLPYVALWAAFGLSALVHLRLAQEPHWRRRLVTSLVTTAACFAFAFLLTLALRNNASRTVILATFGASLVLLALPLVSHTVRRIGWLLLAVLLAALIVLSVRNQLGIRADEERGIDMRSLTSTFYPLELKTYRGYVPLPAVRGGGLSLLSDGSVLLAAGDGHMYRLSLTEDDLRVQPLPLRVPLNGEEFARAVGGEYVDPNNLGRGGLKNRPGVQTWRFRVAGIFVREHANGARVYAAHHYWNDAQRCFFVRLSAIDLSLPLSASTQGEWQTLYDTKPCLPLEGEGSLRGKNPFVGEEVGGRMAMLDEHTLLLTLGEMGFSGLDSTLAPTQDPNADYGKTLAFDLRTHTPRVFTTGHRNAQGLYVDPQGQLWLTEHAARGGDELNLLREGLNYGWPRVTYGTDYGQFMWPLTSTQGQHEGYEKPVFAWVPSIGVSSLIGIRGDLFAVWKNDLLAGSLATRSLYRLKVEQGRVVFSEPIPLDQRVRDLLELPDGRLLIWADGGLLTTMQPARSTGGAMLFGLHCGGCHTARDGYDHRAGPDLLNVFGSDIASTSFTGYSQALRDQPGTWTAQTLDDFIRDPQAFAPGTTMLYGGMPDAAQRRDLIEYLRSVKRD